jgi:phosphonoacetate hydrolase
MMHTYAAEEEPSLEHLHTLDKLLGDLVDDHPGLELYLTADHGMNRKDKGIDLGRILKANGITAEVIPIIRDKHFVHHQNLGGSCYVYLERKADLREAFDLLKAIPGVTEIYEAADTARLFQLHPGRIGDLFVMAAMDTVFGDLDQPREDVKVRSHGSRFEQQVPLLVYGRKVDLQAYEYNLDLTRKLSLD